METKKIVLHKGIFKTEATVTEAVFLITGMTIGAGILAIPYAVSQVGLVLGLVYIAALGTVILFLNLMIGEIALRTKEKMQLSGFAEKYLGKWAKVVMAAITISMGFGTLLVYIIGEGKSLAALFGGSEVMWSVLFWMAASFVLWGGLKRVKVIDKTFGIIIFAIIISLSFFLLPHFRVSEVSYVNSGNLILPLGVILFALSSSSAVAEVHALLPGSERHFRRALILGTLIPMALYILFTIAVVGFTGRETTELATIGLGAKLGPVVGIIANVFAVLAMTTCFLGLGTAMTETFSWDYKIPELGSLVLVVFVPLSLFLLGARNFFEVLSTVGGVFMGIEGIIMAGIYLSARKNGDLVPQRYLMPRDGLVITVPMFLFFGTLLLLSIYGVFIK